MFSKKSSLIAIGAFMMLAVANVVANALGASSAAAVIKPLLMPSLLIGVLLELLPEHGKPLLWWLVIGMLLHTAGDVFLIHGGETMFLLGLGAFLLGHFCYMVVILHKIGGLSGWKELSCLLIPLLLQTILPGIFGLDWPMSAAVSAYGFTLMCIVGWGVLWKMRGRQGALNIIIGGILFVISDSLLAVNNFLGLEFPMHHAIVMATYLTAEYLLVSGMVTGVFKRQIQ